MGNEIHGLKINKATFKVGSLDQLMGMNESTAKLDAQLDVICKKVERVALDNTNDPNKTTLTFKTRN